VAAAFFFAASTNFWYPSRESSFVQLMSLQSASVPMTVASKGQWGGVDTFPKHQG
jgi:hypothetical protein